MNEMNEYSIRAEITDRYMKDFARTANEMEKYDYAPFRVRWLGNEIGAIRIDGMVRTEDGGITFPGKLKYIPIEGAFNPFIENTSEASSNESNIDLPCFLESNISLAKIKLILKNPESVVGRYISGLSVGLHNLTGELDFRLGHKGFDWLFDGLDEKHEITGSFCDEDFILNEKSNIDLNIKDSDIMRLALSGGMSNITGQHMKLPVNRSKDGFSLAEDGKCFTHIAKFNSPITDGSIKTKDGKIVNFTAKERYEIYDPSVFVTLGEWWGSRAMMAAGVDVGKFALSVGKNDSGFVRYIFITERWDIPDTKSDLVYATQDMSSILGVAQYRDGDLTHKFRMESVIEQVANLCPREDMEKLYRIIIGSVIVGNNDLHLKNMSILRTYRKSDDGYGYELVSQKLSPCYDVVPHQLPLYMNAKDDKERRKLIDECFMSTINEKPIGSPESLVSVGRTMGFSERRIKEIMESVAYGIDEEMSKVIDIYSRGDENKKLLFCQYGPSGKSYLDCAFEMCDERIGVILDFTKKMNLKRRVAVKR